MVPVLTMLFNIVGVMGAFFVAVALLGLDPGVFMDRLQWLVDWDDVSQGLIKAMVFGVAVTLIACRQGFYAKGGAAGVGRATNRAVVQSAIAILVLDYHRDEPRLGPRALLMRALSAQLDSVDAASAARASEGRPGPRSNS